MLFVAGLFLFCFDRAVCVIDYFSLMEILKCFGLGLYCGSFLSVFLSLGFFCFGFGGFSWFLSLMHLCSVVLREIKFPAFKKLFA